MYFHRDKALYFQADMQASTQNSFALFDSWLRSSFAKIDKAPHLPWYSTNRSGNCCFKALIFGTSHTWMYGFSS